MSEIELEVDMIHRGKQIAILSDGQEVPVVFWFGPEDYATPEEAVSCVCGPDFDGGYYAVNLADFTGKVQ